MAEKIENKRFENIEDELKKMLRKSPHKKDTEVKNTHEIEADLKRMLNVQPSSSSSSNKRTVSEGHLEDSQQTSENAERSGMQDSHSTIVPSIDHGVVVTMEDLQNLTSSRPHNHSSHENDNVTESARKKRNRKKKKGKHQEEDERPAVHHHHRQHQEDPPIVTDNADDESQLAVVKKKKKNKRTQKKGKDVSPVGLDSGHNVTESDGSEEELTSNEKVPRHRLLEFHRTRYLDDKLTPEIMCELEDERIFPMKKQSAAFPKAKYFCRLCDYHCDNIPISRKHAEDARHRRKIEIMVQDRMLKNLPTPSERHMAALDAVIENIFLVHGLTDDEICNRQEITEKIQSDLKSKLPDIQLRSFGSSVSGFGLKDADLNMNLDVPKGKIPAHYLIQVLHILNEKSEYKNVRRDFQAKVPAVLFMSPCGSLQCQITIGCELSCYTSQYLAIHSNLDDRLRKLAVAFKYWAQVCQLDDQEAGSLPKYCYGIMTIYFLQQITHPILPVFWKDLSEEALKRPQSTKDLLNLLSEFRDLTWKTKNTESVGKLWKDLLMFYGVNFSIADHVISIRSKTLVSRSAKKWKSKRLAIEDPFSTKRNVARSLQNLRMFDYFYNCLRKAGLYFSLPTSHQNVDEYNKCMKSALRNKKSHQKTDLNQISNIHSELVLTNKKLIETDKNSSSVKLESESTEQVSVRPIDVMNKSDDSQVSESDIPPSNEQSMKTVDDDQTADGENEYGEKHIAKNFVEEVIASAVDAVKKMSVGDKKDQSVSNSDKTTMLDSAECHNNENMVNMDVGEVIEEHQDKDEGLASDSDSCFGFDNDSEQKSDSSPVVNMRQEMTSPVGAEYDYKFDSQTLTDGKGPSIVCCVCDKEGHLKTNCPEDELPKIIELPHLPKTHLQKLSQVIKQVPKDFRLSEREMAEREHIRQDLEQHIQSLYPGAKFELFGSSKNGFGFHQSDLDICVTFEDKRAEDVNFVEHIEAICKKLKSVRGLYGVFPITTAKVPIVKFVHRQAQLEGDISMYNVLAMQNTKLLYTYARMDPRVQTLGYAIKVLAKVCDIGDASRGSLSSYAYMLMMIHYLQHTKPPIVPVLQELRYPEDPNPEYMVEGWNTWFFDNIDDLPLVWSGCGKNAQSVGELWLGFFRYYLEEFSFLENVVTIRQFQPLAKFEKLWNGKCIAIEDPFDLDHNLGGALSRRMNQYIVRTFVHARELYGVPFNHLPDGFNRIEDYFFDKGHLVDGELPSDRLCRVCSKIGHIAKECPVLLAKKEREAQRREEAKKQEGTSSGKHSGPRHHNNHNIERHGTPRSLSDPSSEDNSARGTNRGRINQRQHSQPNTHSPDKRQQIPKLMDYRHQDEYSQGNYGSPQSHHYDYQPSYSPNRRSQKHPGPRSPLLKTPTNYGYRQQQGYSNQQYHYSNKTDNSRPMFDQGQATSRSGPQYSANQNYDLRQHRNYVQADTQHYPTSPSHNQHQAVFKNQPSQVYIDPNMFVGYQRCLLTNSVSNHPVNVMSSVPLFINTSMTAGQAFPLATTPVMTYGVNIDNQLNNRPPVCMTDWNTAQLQASLGNTQIPLVSNNPSIVTAVNMKQEHLNWTGVDQFGRPLESVNNSGRTVNVQKTGRNQSVPDFGVTVKNEYYENKQT